MTASKVMRIKLADSGASVPRTPSHSPSLAPSVSAEPEPPPIVTVKLSSTARALAVLSLFYPALRDQSGLYELLTADDHALLARAYRLAESLGLPALEADKLAADLVAYRTAQAYPPGPGPQAQTARLCALAQFSPRDEALARAILVSSALRDPAIDHAFLRQLLDPDQSPMHAVDFEFLRRLVQTLAPAPASGAPAAKVVLARRDAREALARVVASLAPQLELEPRSIRQSLTRGSLALIERLVKRAPGAPVPAQRTFARLTRADRDLLRVLYAAAEAEGSDLEAVDALAHALGALRRAERTASGDSAPQARQPGSALAHAATPQRDPAIRNHARLHDGSQPELTAQRRPSAPTQPHAVSTHSELPTDGPRPYARPSQQQLSDASHRHEVTSQRPSHAQERTGAPSEQDVEVFRQASPHSGASRETEFVSQRPQLSTSTAHPHDVAAQRPSSVQQRGPQQVTSAPREPIAEQHPSAPQHNARSAQPSSQGHTHALSRMHPSSELQELAAYERGALSADGAGTHANELLSSPSSARVLAAAHLAARSASAYGSLAPPPRVSTLPPGSPRIPSILPSPVTPALELAAPNAQPPLDLARALGLSSLVAELHTRRQPRRAVRKRFRRVLRKRARDAKRAR